MADDIDHYLLGKKPNVFLYHAIHFEYYIHATHLTAQQLVSTVLKSSRVQKLILAVS